MAIQNPTSGLLKPNAMSLSAATDWSKKSPDENNSQVKQADSLVRCVQNFAKRARHIVGDLRSVLPVSTD